MLDTKTLKPGDEVACYYGRGFGTANYTIRKVVKVSPSGQVTLDDGTRYTARCQQVGSRQSTAIREVDGHVRDTVLKQRLIREIDSRTLSQLDRLPVWALERLATLSAEIKERAKEGSDE